MVMLATIARNLSLKKEKESESWNTHEALIWSRKEKRIIQIKREVGNSIQISF